ncbi:50S ribosomal protein L23 [Candidatus Woesearchaeota archaeon]|nr:50S ribosomal protein L23 [Candidatus Woesearchaeota archaeon]
MDTSAVIKHPLSTEKSIRLMETQNTLIFAVNMRANKQDIKQAMEQVFKAKVERVNTYIHKKGEKRAYVTFAPETPAIDIATNLGLL